MFAPICRHDVRAAGAVTNVAAEQLQGQIDVPAVTGDIRGVAVGSGELLVSLELIEMLRVDREENAFIEQLENVIDS
jgi:hypothetical protein